MSRIVVCLIALLLVACAPTPDPTQSEASAEPSAASQNPVLPSPIVIPTAPPRHSSDSMRAVLNAFRAIGIELTTNDIPANGELVLKANVDDDNVRIILASAAGDQYQLRISSVVIDDDADPDTAAEVQEAFALAAGEMSKQEEEAIDLFSDDLTSEEGGRSLTVNGKDGHDYELTSFFDNGDLGLAITYAGPDSVPPSATETEEAKPSD